MMRSMRVDNDIRGVLSKAKGQSARLAAILHVVDFCIKTATSQPDGINRLPLEVGEDVGAWTALLLSWIT